ncbi:MAG: PD-(D/E)XK nuclease family protein, partial [Acidobacteriota bacterium]
VQFRADRLDRIGETLRFTDYKAGALPDDAVREETRHKHLLDAIGRGERLQVAAYVASAAGASVEGRYVYLKPLERRPGSRVAAVQGHDGEAAARFRGAVQALIGLWDEGGFFPRLVGADGRSQGDACGYCEVKQACLQPDSGARRRLARWMAAREGAGAQAAMPLAPLEAAMLSAWLLQRKQALGPGAKEAT